MIPARLARRTAGPVIIVIAAATALVIQRTGERGEHPDQAPPATHARTPRPSTRVTPTVTPAALPTFPPASPATPTSSTSSPSSPRPTPPARSTKPTKPPTTPAPAPASPTQHASLDGLLQQDGPVPDGIPAQLHFFLGGGPTCPDIEDPVAGVGVPHLPVVIPSVPVFCLEGFETRRGVTVVFTASDGTTDTLTVPAYAHHYDGLYYRVPPGSPAGRYRVRATQGSTTATADFQVVRARKPHLWIYPATPDAGTTIDVYIGGFPPGRPADLYLYACLPLTYRATHTVAIDARGEAHLALHTSASTERTCYAVNSPLVFIPSDPPVIPAGGEHQVFWLRDPSPPEPPPNCMSAAPRC